MSNSSSNLSELHFLLLGDGVVAAQNSISIHNIPKPRRGDILVDNSKIAYSKAL